MVRLCWMLLSSTLYVVSSQYIPCPGNCFKPPQIQTAFCRSDFVMKMEIKSVLSIKDKFITIYTVNIIETYKLNSEYKYIRTVLLYTHNDGYCGLPNLKAGITYILSGVIDKEDGIFSLNNCVSMAIEVKPSSKLKILEENFRDEYGNNCDYCRIEHCFMMNECMEKNKKRGNDKCVYFILEHDCLGLYSACKYNDKSKRCEWSSLSRKVKRYKECDIRYAMGFFSKLNNIG